MYITADLRIDGALDEDVQFNSDDEFDEWLNDIKEESGHWRHREESWQVFRIVHEHPLTNECMCVQYLTDHHAFWEK